MCRKSIYELRSKYDIYQYDYLGMHYALEWILTGDMKNESLDEFIESCNNMLVKIQNPKY